MSLCTLEVAYRVLPFPPQCSPGVLVLRVANRHGDFVWSRGETRDPSKAENPGHLAHVPSVYRLSNRRNHYSC
jgi:hypothetical protein